MRRIHAERSDTIRLALGEVVEVESLRLAVAPPNVLLVPVAEEPDVVEIVGHEPGGEDGVHVSLYRLRAVKAGTGQLRLGYKDLRSGELVAQKEITVKVVDPDASRPTPCG